MTKRPKTWAPVIRRALEILHEDRFPWRGVRTMGACEALSLAAEEFGLQYGFNLNGAKSLCCRAFEELFKPVSGEFRISAAYWLQDTTEDLTEHNRVIALGFFLEIYGRNKIPDSEYLTP